MIEKGLKNLLINDPTVASMTGGTASPFTPGNRVRPMLLPEGSDLPAIVYSQVASNYVISLDGLNPLQMKRFQLDCYGANAPAAKNLAMAVHNLLDGFSGTLDEGTNVESCFPNQDVDTFEFDPMNFRVACDFDIWFIPGEYVPDFTVEDQVGEYWGTF
jgi:hypothetical protein